jgi:hypothetical protein
MNPDTPRTDDQFRDATKMVPDHIVEANKMVPVVKESLTTQTDTPRTEAARFEALLGSALRRNCIPLKLGQELERELNASKAEVERLRKEIAFREDTDAVAQEVWDERKAENVKLRTENVCLQELIQEFYSWSKRDFPTEAEVRELMDRYYDLLNK